MLIFLFSTLPVYCFGFVRRWRINLPYGFYGLIAGGSWVLIDFFVHGLIHQAYQVQKVPAHVLISAAGVDGLLVACLFFAFTRTTDQHKTLQAQRRIFEDEVRNGLQAVVYAVALMDADHSYMPYVTNGLNKVERAFKEFGRCG